MYTPTTNTSIIELTEPLYFCGQSNFFTIKLKKMAKKKNQVDVHHRVPLSRNGLDIPSNCSRVRKSHHRAYHQIFGTDSPQKIAEYLTEKWIDPSYVMVAVPKEDYEKVQQVLFKGSRY